MKSITVHNIDTQTIQRIEEISRSTGKSLNKVIKELLHDSLGINTTKRDLKEQEFGEFFGVWTEEEYEGFQRNMKDFDQIDESDWK